MTKLLERALEAVRQLPPDSQDEIARAMLNLAGNEGEPEEIDPAHLPDVLEGLAQARRRSQGARRAYESLQNLILFPLIGRPQRAEGVRKLVTRNYAYLVYYTVDV